MWHIWRSWTPETAKSLKRSAVWLVPKLKKMAFWVSTGWYLFFFGFVNAQVTEEVSKNLASLKEILSGTGDKEPQTEAVAQLAQEFYNTDALILLVANLQKVDFEVGGMKHFSKLSHDSPESLELQTPVHAAWLCALLFFFFCLQGKKDVVHLFSNIVRRQIGTRVPTVEYISSKPEILFMLLRGWVLPVISRYMCQWAEKVPTFKTEPSAQPALLISTFSVCVWTTPKGTSVNLLHGLHMWMRRVRVHLVL